jgi:rhamnogalacturonan endolyase
MECWGGTSGLRTCTNGSAGSAPASTNFVIWWDGDLLRELLDGTTISKFGGGTLLSASGCASNNGTKSTPCLSADLCGDWREEVIFRTSDNTALRIYTTTTTTTSRFYTLMHDPQYRLSIAWQNVAYNQPPHTGFYLGDGMAQPPVPNIYLAP